jgi:hypothetical protein
MIYVIGADCCPHQLLEHEILFVGASGRGEPADGIWTGLLPDSAKIFGNQFQRLIPAGRLELPAFLPANQRGREAVFAVYKFIAEPPLGAKPAFIMIVTARRYTGNLVTNRMDGDITTTAAITAGCLGTFDAFVSWMPLPHLRGQRTGWTNRNTLPAELAIQVMLEGRADFGIKTAIRITDSSDTLN